MKTIKDEWENFKSMVVPPGASELQKSEMKLAFYGGATVMLNIMSMVANMSTKEGFKLLEVCSKECENFVMERMLESKSKQN